MPTTEASGTVVPWAPLHCGFSCFCRCRWSLWPQSGIIRSKTKFIYRVLSKKWDDGGEMAQMRKYLLHKYENLRLTHRIHAKSCEANTQHCPVTYSCIHTQMYVHMHVILKCIHADMHVHTYIIHIGKNKHAHAYVNMQVHTSNTCTHMNTRRHTHMQIHAYTHAYTVMHAHIHTARWRT